MLAKIVSPLPIWTHLIFTTTYEVGTGINPFLEIRELRPREICDLPRVTQQACGRGRT